MNHMWIYLRLQLKKIAQLLPRLIAGTAVLVILTGAIAFYGTRLLYSRQAAESVTIVIVLEDDSPLMEFGMHYLESSESVNSFCRLVKASKEEAETMLEKQQAAACIYFPKNFAKDIASGKNTPATITFSGDTGIEQLLFQELTNAAARILTSAQAGIYSLGDVYQNHDFHKRRGVHYDYINQNTMQTALVRSRLFEVKNISSTGAVSTKEYYTASALVLLLFLSGMPLSRLAQPESKSLAALLSRSGLRAPRRTLLKGLALVCFYAAVLSLLFLVCCLFSLLPWRAFWLLPLFSLLAGSWTLFFYSMAANETTGTLLMFIAAFLCTFCSGGFLPPAFLPQIVSAAAQALPTYYAHRLLCASYHNTAGTGGMLCLLLFTAVFLTLSCLFSARAERRDPL